MESQLCHGFDTSAEQYACHFVTIWKSLLTPETPRSFLTKTEFNTWNYMSEDVYGYTTASADLYIHKVVSVQYAKSWDPVFWQNVFFGACPSLNYVKVEQIFSLYSRFYFEFKFTLRGFPNALLLIINVLKDAPYPMAFVSYVSLQEKLVVLTQTAFPITLVSHAIILLTVRDSI